MASFLPYYLPVFFPVGATVFKMFRVIRVLRLFQINAYYDSLKLIGDVMAGKRQQLMSSMFIIGVLMLGSSLCMYSVEHETQPEVFSNAFSGLWWAASTVLTIGYGDIYPITTMGKELDISRQTIIVMVKRNGTMLVPNGNFVLMEGDHVILYSQERINHASLIQI